jgi:hypothetical protein
MFAMDKPLTWIILLAFLLIIALVLLLVLLPFRRRR